jgi:hypothetical protein
MFLQNFCFSVQLLAAAQNGEAYNPANRHPMKLVMCRSSLT